ncbi:MAG: hypothetical protein LBG21_04175 [Campylobacteraceae bacterium]|jgi:hypothetical protein|nr:hypothetical protein [Campylobacteraceae bacterium]
MKLFNDFSKQLWFVFFKKPIDEIPQSDSDVNFKATIQMIKDYFNSSEWNKVYDFIQTIVSFGINTDDFIKTVNEVLEVEFSAYRLIDKQLVPIFNKIEIKEIEDSLQCTQNFTALNNANLHLQTSLKLLSDRESPDYRNSIKEAISAVEATCNFITKKDKTTLGEALIELEKSINCMEH